MIRCTIVETTSQAGESASRIARATVSETLTLGRAAACKIYLPDPRVRLEHAIVRRAEDGYLYLDGIGGSVLVNNEPLDTLRLEVGQQIVIGPFEFLVSEVVHGPNCQQVQLTLDFTHKPTEILHTESVRAKGGLRKSLFNLRTLSWVAALACLLLLLIQPVWQAYHPKEQTPDSARTNSDVMWNPGPLSSAHTPVGNDCKICHTKPFQRVKDSACTTCHKDTGPHITSHADLQAHTFGDQRCATCHREHQGEDGMKKVDASSCESCHANVKAFAPKTALPNVGDFGKDHPEFRLSMKVMATPITVQRVEMGPTLKEASGLKFPHDVHVSPKGIKSPVGPASTGGRVVLECASCHKLDSAKVRYQPIRMETACGECHRLGIDAQNPTRQVPHAKPSVVMDALHDSFAALALERNPGQLVTINSLLQGAQIQPASANNIAADRWVNDKTLAAAKDMFENPKGTCLTCHTIEKADSKTSASGQPDWKVQPVLSNDLWLPKSKFTHAQHSNAACESCHDAKQSKTSSDILIPPIATCRNCHTGPSALNVQTAQTTKVVNQCNNCHDFHAPVVHATFVAEKTRISGGQKANVAP